MIHGEERLYKIILSQHVTEKVFALREQNGTMMFKVIKDATKAEIKAAVEKLFEMKVSKVRTAVMKGKVKRHGSRYGRRSDWKKAYVTLEDASQIESMLDVQQGTGV